MKKTMILCILLSIFSTLYSPVLASNSIKATKVSSLTSVDGINKIFDAYNINGNNYFKLRDIAYVLNYTEKQFEVLWNNDNQTISLLKGKPYTVLRGEMTTKSSSQIKSATPSQANVYINGEKVGLTAYNINGNNYVKLRDLGEKIDFGVVWDATTQTVQINSTHRYSEDTINPWAYTKMLGKGLDVDWSKTSQGRKYYNKQTVADFKKAGISHVRIRISDKATEDLLQGLDQQIKDCLELGIIPIIAYQADEFKNEPTEKNIQQVVEWWGTVAERYKDYSPLLSFDLLIEATDALNKQPEKLNEIYERLVTKIRQSNATRIIMISPRLRSDADYLHELKIPSKHNGYLMAEWHFYASGPSKTNERKLWTTGTSAEKKLITDKINKALAWQKETGIPTWVGAWMPGNYNDGNDYSVMEQVTFASYMTSELLQAGIPFAVNSDTKYYDRQSNQWIQEMLPVFNSIFYK